MDKIPILSVLTFLPAVAGFLLCFIKKERVSLVRSTVFATSLIVFLLSLVMFLQFSPNAVGMQFVETHSWIPQFSIFYKMGIDGISVLLILLTAFLTPIAILSSYNAIKDKGFYISLLFLETGMLGTFAALDLFLFYIFWEVMLIPMYLIIGVWGGKRRIYAAVKFIIYTMVGSLFMLAAILYVYFRSKEAIPGGSFDIVELQNTLGFLPLFVQRWLFLAFAFAFAIKVPLFPLHTWLPDAHVEAPTAGSVILAGVLLKMGVYGFLRIAIPFFPDAAHYFTPHIMVLSVIGIIFGALMAMTQSDIKKLIAYSSVSHLGFVMLGVFSFTSLGISGGVYQMLNHGISTGALFLLVGIIYERTHRRGVDDFGGMATVTPVYATIFMLVTLSSIGLPGLNGFVGEFLILLGTFGVSKWFAAVATLGVVIGAVYMLKLYRDTMFGKVTREVNVAVKDVSRLEFFYLLPIVILIFVMGLLPNIFLSKGERAVDTVIGKMKPIAIGQNPHFASFLVGSGFSKYSYGDYRGAIADWKKAIEIAPYYASSLKPEIEKARAKINSPIVVLQVKNEVLVSSNIQERVKFSDGLLEWYPNIYQDLATNNAQKKFSILQKITEIDGANKPLHDVTEDDIAGVIGEVLLDDGKGLSFKEKEAICNISRGTLDFYEGIKVMWNKAVPGAAPHIKKLLKDEDKDIRWPTIRVLGLLGTKDAVADIKELLKDGEPVVRSSAIRALSNLGVKESIVDIKGLIKDEDVSVRGSAVLALGKLGAKEAIPDIKELLKDEYLAGCAGIVLVELGAKDAVPKGVIMPIINILKWKDRELSDRAAVALRKLGMSEKMIEMFKNQK